MPEWQTAVRAKGCSSANYVTQRTKNKTKMIRQGPGETERAMIQHCQKGARDDSPIDSDSSTR
jgi:hypothetical protein